MKKIIKSIFTICVIGLVFLAGTSYLNQDKEAPIVEMEGTKIQIGKTTVKEVLDNGFTIKESEISEPVKSVPGKKYTSIIGSFEKDGIHYGSFSVANTSVSEQNVEDCKITSVTYFYSNDHYYQDASVNGMSPKGMTLEQIKEKLGDPEHEYDDRLDYRSKNGKYDSWYEFDENGALKDLELETNEQML